MGQSLDKSDGAGASQFMDFTADDANRDQMTVVRVAEFFGFREIREKITRPLD
ncbi:MAG: hypothetical protein ACLQDV_07905 [Candidatus Binataceae bacterium]